MNTHIIKTSNKLRPAGLHLPQPWKLRPRIEVKNRMGYTLNIDLFQSKNNRRSIIKSYKTLFFKFAIIIQFPLEESTRYNVYIIAPSRSEWNLDLGFLVMSFVLSYCLLSGTFNK